MSLVALLIAAVLPGCGGSAGGDERPDVLVSAAASLRTAFTAYAEDFRAGRVRASFGGSDELAAQIRLGVRPDVFAAADSALPAALHREGLVEEPVVFAANRLVLAVPAGSPIRAVADLARPDTAVVVGAPSAPVGRYTRRVLARLPAGLGEEILRRVRSNEPDVAGIVGKLAQRAADAGFVYRTDVRAAGGALRAIELADRLQPRIVYAAAVVKGARRPRVARRFVHGLLTGAGRRALEGAGFAAPPGP